MRHLGKMDANVSSALIIRKLTVSMCPKHVSFDLLGAYSINMEFLVLRHN